MQYLFEDYSLDTERRELQRGVARVPTAPQVFDLLDFLIRNRDSVVSKDDLIEAVWNGRIISEAALTTRLNAARKAIGDSGKTQRLIKTLPRKGFRFIGSVEEARAATATSDVSSEQGRTGRPPASPPRLSIVVLPFANIGDDPEQAYFVDGMTESLTTDLSRIRGTFVIGRHTAFTYKGQAVDLKTVGRELNVRYTLEGSVQRSGNRLRVNVQLLDTETGGHIWAERFDKPIADLLDMQDEIVSRLAGMLNAQLVIAEARRAERSLNPDAVDLVFQGRARLNEGLTLESLMRARSFFERALSLDCENADALIGEAIVDLALCSALLTDDYVARCAAAKASATKAVSFAPDYALAHLVLGVAHILSHHATEGIWECERALALDPNLADAHACVGWAKALLGRSGETEAHAKEALRLSPRDIYAYRWLNGIGLAKSQMGADAEAAGWLRRSIEANPNQSLSYFVLAATLVRLGDMENARAAVQAGLVHSAGFTIRRFSSHPLSTHPAYLAWRERMYEAMRLAGVPSG